ncbi:uncharacterized protein LOC141913070 [Tubulanus polymorphus]|uniref:uncharacterized protein LOC141913070 n=1 Tax=Tubulanus polymorphus TaxID=672921 RepID=UPI003DA1F55F
METKPTIYLNPTDDSDHPVMLHDGTCRRGSFRGSLPDLKSDDKLANTTATGGGALSTNIRGYPRNVNAKDRRLDAYCSPCFRSRKTFKSLDLDGYDDAAAAVGPWQFDSSSPVDKNLTWSQYLSERRGGSPRMLGRSCSSLGSFDSAQVLVGQSVSNLSMSGSKFADVIENLRFSLPDLRAYHGLDIRHLCTANAFDPSTNGKSRYYLPRRGVKSCSNLTAYDQSTIYGDKSKAGNLLSPQSLMKSPYRSLSISTSPSVESTDDTSAGIVAGEDATGTGNQQTTAAAASVAETACKNREIYDSVYTETRYEKDKRIRRWLKNLSAQNQTGDRVMHHCATTATDSEW